MRLLIDAHLDIAWNALSYDRDQLLPVPALRAAEQGMSGTSRGNCTVSLPEMRKAGIGVCLATLLCRAMPENGFQPDIPGNPVAGRGHTDIILRENLDYANQTIASAAAQGQLAYYRLLEQQGHLRMIADAATLNEVWGQWEAGDATAPIGYILSMEGTDPIVEPSHAEWWWQQGLRTACIAHYGQSAHAMGTGGDGPVTPKGRELLKEFDRLGMILDLVHTADTAFREALDLFGGPIFVSHGNPRRLVPGDRQINDEQIRQIAGRDGVLGAVLDCWMLRPGYARTTREENPPLSSVADQIDAICQITGSSRHVAIGSDLDGGFGTEQSPRDLDTIADLQKLGPMLSERGYSDDQINAIFHGNWLRFFRENLPH